MIVCHLCCTTKNFLKSPTIMLTTDLFLLINPKPLKTQENNPEGTRGSQATALLKMNSHLEIIFFLFPFVLLVVQNLSTHALKP